MAMCETSIAALQSGKVHGHVPAMICHPVEDTYKRRKHEIKGADFADCPFTSPIGVVCESAATNLESLVAPEKEIEDSEIEEIRAAIALDMTEDSVDAFAAVTRLLDRKE